MENFWKRIHYLSLKFIETVIKHAVLPHATYALVSNTKANWFMLLSKPASVGEIKGSHVCDSEAYGLTW